MQRVPRARNRLACMHTYGPARRPARRSRHGANSELCLSLQFGHVHAAVRANRLREGSARIVAQRPERLHGVPVADEPAVAPLLELAALALALKLRRPAAGTDNPRVPVPAPALVVLGTKPSYTSGSVASVHGARAHRSVRTDAVFAVRKAVRAQTSGSSVTAGGTRSSAARGGERPQALLRWRAPGLRRLAASCLAKRAASGSSNSRRRDQRVRRCECV